MTIPPETILNQACLGVIGLDNQGVINYANVRAQEMLGCELTDGTALNTIDAMMWRQIESLIKQGKNGQSVHIPNPEGAGGGIEIVVSLIFHVPPAEMSPASPMEGAICFMRSLEMVEASAWEHPTIKTMHLQFQSLLDHSYYGIYIIDGQGIVLKVNDVAAGLIGMTKKEMLGMPIGDLAEKGIEPFHPEIQKAPDPPPVRCEAQQVYHGIGHTHL